VLEGFDLLLGGGHYEVRMAWRPQNPGFAKAAKPGAPAVNSPVSQNRRDMGHPA
jgi:hypothetical protein